MDLVAKPPPPWAALNLTWAAAIARLQAARLGGALEAGALTPLVEHFDFAWQHLNALAPVAAAFAPPPGAGWLPIHHLAEFVLDDLLDAFRGAASELALLVPSGARWTGDPDPRNVVDEAERFARYLGVAVMAARGGGGADPLSTALIRLDDVLSAWITNVSPLIGPIEEILEAVGHGTGDGFATTPKTTAPN
ncbi:MAG TPA: hypothetical protein VFS20_18215 [Longimicrobium sp.]|nr:hypothetical protein [Longimicrobium sp.]